MNSVVAPILLLYIDPLSVIKGLFFILIKGEEDVSFDYIRRKEHLGRLASDSRKSPIVQSSTG